MGLDNNESYIYDDRLPFIQQIVGHTILSVDATDDGVLEIKTDKGEWRLAAEGDCCSHSYWYKDAFEGLGYLLGQVVISAEDRYENLGEVHDDTTGYGSSESRTIYATALATKLGVCVLEMRNDSNGYYGGSYSASYKQRA